MKIFLPFAVSDIGGTSIFAQKFKAGMEKAGHEVFFEYQPDYDVLFVIAQAPFKLLWDAKKRGIPIVQRLDGVYYWRVAGILFPLYNLKIFLTRHFFATYTVYQSAYSKFCVETFLLPKKHEQSVLIYNGVNTEAFTPQGDSLALRDNPDQTLFFTASTFRRNDQMVSLLKSLEYYNNNYSSNWKFLIAGNFKGQVASLPAKYADCKNIVFLGKIKNDALAQYERSVDAFLFTHANSACPNAVLEALGSGLPIVGIADGAMPELVESGKEGVLLPVQGSAFWKEREFSEEKFADNIAFVLQNKQLFSKNARQTAMEKFTLQNMIDKYLTLFSSLQ